MEKVNPSYFLGILSCFVLGIPFVELSILLINFQFNIELFTYLIFLSFTFLALLLFFYKKYKKPIQSYRTPFFKNDNHEKRFQAFSFLISSIFFVLFCSFMLNNIQSIEELAFFSERYRNAAFKGSGIYTIGITKISPLFISVILANANRIRITTTIVILMVLFASFALGFRVYLLGIFIFLSFRLLNQFGVRKSLIYLLPFFAFMIFFKVFLNDQFFEMSLSDRILNIAGRIEYRNLLESWLFTSKGNFNTFIKYLPGINWFTGIDVSSFKEEFVKNISNVTVKIPYINLYSGVAIPILVILYNYFGFLFIIPCFALLIVFSILSFQQIFSKKPLVRILCLYIFLQLFGMLVEDVDFISNFLYIFFLVPLIYTIYFLSSKKILINSPKKITNI